MKGKRGTRPPSPTWSADPYRAPAKTWVRGRAKFARRAAFGRAARLGGPGLLPKIWETNFCPKWSNRTTEGADGTSGFRSFQRHPRLPVYSTLGKSWFLEIPMDCQGLLKDLQQSLRICQI